MLFCYILTYADSHLHTCTYICRIIHNDTMIMTHAGRRLLYKYICTSHFIGKGSKRVTQGLRVRGSWRSNRTAIFWPHCYGRQRCVFLVLPGCSTGGPGAHSAAWWLSLLHLISNLSGPQTPSGFPRAPSAGCGFPYHISSITPISNSTATIRRTQLSWLLSWLSYIIVQRPLDLWNRMFNRHQAEITVMQFRGHSLPVRQSMRVSWDFLACLILLANFRPRDFLS